MREQRHLAAILVADVVGYSRLVGIDEAGTLAKLAALKRELIEPVIGRHSGRLFKAVGDGFLVEFASAVQAVTCAVEIQKAGSALPLRIGIHLGDVVVQGDDLMGDGVNIAARIEGVAEVGGIAISRQVHDQVRDRLDIGFEDKGEVSLKNIARPVHVFVIAGAKVPTRTPALVLPDKPSIAVLPFQNMSGDPEQEYFADGMVEDIITALSRFKSLFVIARNSSFTYKGKAVDIKQVGRELGVRYVLEGSVRKSGDRVRITGQLIEAETGAHLWADRYDGALADIFSLQDRVSASVIGAIAPNVERAEVERAKRKPVSSLAAYDVFLRGIAAMQVSNKEALHLFYRAMELDPNFPGPYGLAARCHAYRLALHRLANPVVDVAEARRLAERVIDIGQDDAQALTWAGLALVDLCREYERGETLIDQALAINPNLAVAWTNRGLVSSYLGKHQEAIGQLSQALRLSPMDSEAYRAEFVLSFAYGALGDHAHSLTWARKSHGHRPGISASFLMVASVYNGDMETARQMASELQRILPGMTITSARQSVAWRRPQDLDWFFNAYRRAGIRE